ncbi:hypothetical protein [Xanthobacter aminoxidans]|uniref:hypothetical protein n=1 Tax=Xanthobacter aminoxidans TaxID=186280 RepID=UPI00202310A9|nr:hypothetical protein [Xanthobacter aminoxidans]MCL8382483.1 hypothetical protein [Xanthobacter aminoxidans]
MTATPPPLAANDEGEEQDAGATAVVNARRLREVARRALAGEPLGPHGPWLAYGFLTYLDAAASGITLDDAFGVATQIGAAPWWTIEDQARRDRALCALFAMLPEDRSFAARIDALSAQLRRYAVRWRRTDHHLPACPESYSGRADALLFEAFHACGGGVPFSPRRLRDILTSI